MAARAFGEILLLPHPLQGGLPLLLGLLGGTGLDHLLLREHHGTPLRGSQVAHARPGCLGRGGGHTRPFDSLAGHSHRFHHVIPFGSASFIHTTTNNTADAGLFL